MIFVTVRIWKSTFRLPTQIHVLAIFIISDAGCKAADFSPDAAERKECCSYEFIPEVYLCFEYQCDQSYQVYTCA
jgi:hypothetical protein